MRALLLAALALFALPALAQTDDREVDRDADIETDDEVILRRSDDGREVRVRVERDGPRVIVRRDDGGEVDERVIELDLDGPLGVLERMSEDSPFGMLRSMMGGAGASPETRARMRELESQADDLARQARNADGAERTRLERELDGVLGELFDVRGQARAERADSLRERADELRQEADEMDAATAERASRRRALIEARRAELLGAPTVDF